MKNFLLLITLLLCFSSIAQQYEFDFISHYKSNENGFSRETISYSNSKNPNYFLGVYDNNNKRYAILYDLKTQLKHRFDVISINEKAEVMFQFNYLYSDDLKNKRVYTFDIYDFTTVENDSTGKTVQLNFYANKKRKSKIRSLEIKMIKSNANHFPNFRFSTIHPMEHEIKMDINENYIVTESYQINKKAKTPVAKLIEYKETDIKLQINKVKIIK